MKAAGETETHKAYHLHWIINILLSFVSAQNINISFIPVTTSTSYHQYLISTYYLFLDVQYAFNA